MENVSTKSGRAHEKDRAAEGAVMLGLSSQVTKEGIVSNNCRQVKGENDLSTLEKDNRHDSAAQANTVNSHRSKDDKVKRAVISVSNKPALTKDSKAKVRKKKKSDLGKRGKASLEIGPSAIPRQREELPDSDSTAPLVCKKGQKTKESKENPPQKRDKGMAQGIKRACPSPEERREQSKARRQNLSKMHQQ